MALKSDTGLLVAALLKVSNGMVVLQEQAQDARGRGDRLSVVPIPSVEESMPSIFNDVMASNLNSMIPMHPGCCPVAGDIRSLIVYATRCWLIATVMLWQLQSACMPWRLVTAVKVSAAEPALTGDRCPCHQPGLWLSVLDCPRIISDISISWLPLTQKQDPNSGVLCAGRSPTARTPGGQGLLHLPAAPV